MPDIKYMYVIALLLFPLWVGAFLPKEDAVPGGVAIIQLPEKYSLLTMPVVRFEQKRVALIRSKEKHNTYWYAVVGLPLTLKPGVYSVEVTGASQVESMNFQVKDKLYPAEHLRFKDKKHVTPDEAIQKRITQEQAHLAHVFSIWSPRNLDAFGLKKPLQGRISSGFGKRRLLNGKVSSRHQGIDIAAQTGTWVQAAKQGSVVDVGDYFYTGKTVVLDHGQGFKTVYCHLDTVTIKSGDWVQVGQRIGQVGQTGRATGPHLHFGVSLNNERVSPNLFF